jgi:hypothetical protein
MTFIGAEIWDPRIEHANTHNARARQRRMACGYQANSLAHNF